MEFNLAQGLYRTLLTGSFLGALAAFLVTVYSLMDERYPRGVLFFGIFLILLLVFSSLLK